MLQAYIDNGGAAAAFLYTNCPDYIIENTEIFICTHELELSQELAGETVSDTESYESFE